MNPTVYAKALVGALVAGLGSLYQALDNDAVTRQEWVAVALAVLASLAVVYGVPNRDPHGRHQDESVQPPERGATDVVTAMVVVFLVVVVLILLGVIR